MPTIAEILAGELNVPVLYAENVVRLLDEGNTIPFIARYRKELHGAWMTPPCAHGGTAAYLRSLQQRRQEVLRAIEAQGKLTEQLTAAVDNARNAGRGGGSLSSLQAEAPHPRHRGPGKGPGTAGRAVCLLRAGTVPVRSSRARLHRFRKRALNLSPTLLQGANDIIAEWIQSDDVAIRKLSAGAAGAARYSAFASPPRRRTAFTACTTISSSPSANLQGHQILAINRGEKRKSLHPSPSCWIGSRRCRCCGAPW